MPVMHHLPFNYNNLVINLVVPGSYNYKNPPENDWLPDRYKEIEDEYESLENKKDCSIYIFSVRPKNWDNEKPLIKIARKLINGKFIDITGFENFDFYTSENITTLLNEVLKVEGIKYFTNKVLVTYGHSSGYYFFGHKNPDKQRLHNDLEYPKMSTIIDPMIVFIKGLFLRRSTKNVPQQIPTNYDETPCISANTLARGINNSVIKKFDAIILGGCNMQNIDVQSTLKNCCNFLIASQTFLPVKAYQFKSIISNRTTINFDHCKSIIAESNRHLGIGGTGISIVNTEYLEPLIKSINKINKYLTSNFDDLKQTIVNTRNSIEYINGGNEIYSIDLFEFYIKLFRNYALWPEDIQTEFENLFDKIKVRVVYVQNLYAHSGLSGMCIYFPETKEEYYEGAHANNIIYGPSPMTNSYFSENSSWGEFLKILYY